MATISFWEKPALATTNQDNYLSEISLTTDNSKYTASPVNPDLKIAIRKLTEQETEQLLKPVDLSSELLLGEVEANQEKLAESPDFCCQNENINKSQKIAQTDSSEVIGDTLGEANKLRQELLIDPITVEVTTSGGAAPGSTAGTPSAYGASWGQAYVGGGLFFPLDKGRTDGSLSVGFGLGDTVKSVGVEVNANITSVGGGNSNFDFGDSGSLGFKVHKYLGDGAAVAVGFANPITWGDSNKAKDTIYGVATKSFNLQPNDPDNKMPLTISLGVGSGSFRSKGAIEADDNPANIFGSIGIRTAPQVAWVTSWTGNRLNIGGSFVPFKQTPIVFNAIFTDVTNNFDDGLGISLSAGYAIRF
ncbi:MAG: hypothetical protein ACFCUV_01025 [Rivularia sp. (in: cyanobacteria)]